MTDHGKSAAELLPAVYDELRRMARSHLHKSNGRITLDSADLANETCLHFLAHGDDRWHDSAMFRAIAHRKMSQILIDYIKRRQSKKRGGGGRRGAGDADPPEQRMHRVPLETVTVEWGEYRYALPDLYDALEALRRADARLATALDLYWFAGCTAQKIADTVGVTPQTIRRRLHGAIEWLDAHLKSTPSMVSAFDDTPLAPQAVENDDLFLDELPPAMTAYPHRIGPYHVIRPLATGGMGAVYLVADEDKANRYAAKIPLVKDGNDKLTSRLRHEAGILRELSHPGIGRFVEIREERVAGRVCPVIITEYIAGTPITDYVRREQIDFNERLTMLINVARAMDHAHGRNIVHLDLKPNNILVTGAGDARIIDFGIAGLHCDAPHPSFGGRMGTPIYASPEQLTGADQIGFPSDVYALAIIGYELLADGMANEREEDAHNSARRAQLIDTLCNASDVDPAQRPQTAGALADQLVTALPENHPARLIPTGDESTLSSSLRRVVSTRIKMRND